MYPEYENTELLRQLLAYQKKEARHARVTAWVSFLLALVILAALVLAVPKAVKLVKGVETTLAKVDVMTDAAEELVANANTMVLKNTDAVTETIRKLNELDFDSLNNAIRNLDDAVRPLAELARKLS
jgi:hypothetical protein